MHSPKFPLKAKKLRDVINAPRLKYVWKSKVRESMRRQPMPDPLEHLDFHIRIDAICAAIQAEVLSAAYIPAIPIRFLAEKSKGLCRQLVIPSVKDALILQTLSDFLWAEIRSKAPTKKSFYAPEDHQFSKTIKGHSSEYGAVQAWLKFQETIFGFAKSKKLIVVTDIANYYDTISYDHLRNILADYASAGEHALDLLIYTLSCMLWQPDYMPRVPVGLPQAQLDAPRLLAHCFLFEIDEMLSHNKSIDFARYMDDMDIGVDSLREAREILRDLDLALQTRQIRLNSGKTKILDDQQARLHFKIRENMLLDRLSDRIQRKIAAGAPLDREQRLIEKAIRTGLRKGIFFDGNGEKIFKRLLNFSRVTGAHVDDAVFELVLRDWPNLRRSVLMWWYNSNHPERKLNLLHEALRDGNLIDDAARMEIAVALVCARLPSTMLTALLLPEIINSVDHKTVWGFYSKVWMLSKYGGSAELLRVIEETVSLWVTRENLSRLVAGLYPRFLGTPQQGKFEAIIRRAGNAWSMPVMQFHEDLAKGTVGYSAIKKFIVATNPSLPNKISHSKFLMLTSLLKNPSLASAAVGDLKKIHAVSLSDDYYKGI